MVSESWAVFPAPSVVPKCCFTGGRWVAPQPRAMRCRAGAQGGCWGHSQDPAPRFSTFTPSQAPAAPGGSCSSPSPTPLRRGLLWLAGTCGAGLEGRRGVLGFTPLAMKRGGCQEYHGLQGMLAHPVPPNAPRRAPVTQQRPPQGAHSPACPGTPIPQPTQPPGSCWGGQGLPTGQEAWAQTAGVDTDTVC